MEGGGGGFPGGFFPRTVKEVSMENIAKEEGTFSDESIYKKSKK